MTEWFNLAMPGSILVVASGFFLVMSHVSSEERIKESWRWALSAIYFALLSAIWWIGGLILISN